MEMATQAKTKTIPVKVKVSSSTTTTAKAQATTATATGNGNPYTQNIKTVKKLFFTEKINKKRKQIYKEHTRTATHIFYEIQNNKTEIKISKYKQRNYLKFLINLLYLKIILCISQINKLILITKTKTKTKQTTTTTKTNTYNNYNYKIKNKNNLNYLINFKNCIITKNPQQNEKYQKQLNTAKCFKTISFKFKIVINFLIQFNYDTQKTLEKYVKILIKKILHNKQIIKHFVGICPKRLISLKRLQQIPENQVKVEEEKLNSLKAGNYHYEELQLKKRETNLSYQIIKSIQMQEYKKESLEDKEYLRKLLKSKQDYKHEKLTYQFRHNKQTHTSSAGEELKIHRTSYKKLKPLSECEAELKAQNGAKEFNKRNYNEIKKELGNKYKEIIYNSSLIYKQENPLREEKSNAESSPHIKEFKVNKDLQCSLNKWSQFNKEDEHQSKVDLNLYSQIKSIQKDYENFKDSEKNCRSQISQKELNIIQYSPKNYGPLNNSKSSLENKDHIAIRSQNKTLLECSLENKDRLENKTLLKLKETLEKAPKAFRVALEFNNENDGKDLSKSFKQLELKELFQYPNNKQQNLLKYALQQNSTENCNFRQTILQSFKPVSENYDIHLNFTPQQSQQQLNKTSQSPHKSNLSNRIKSTQQFLLMHKNNSYENSRHLKIKESKLQKYLKKCQHFLYTILLYKICCCFWHIYGFPLVLVKFLKYFKDSTVHVLTRRLKTSSTKTKTAATTTTTSTLKTDYNYSNVIAACGGKMKKPTKMADYKANQQNVLKTPTYTDTSRQTATTTKTTTFNTCAYSTSSTSTTSSSSFASTPYCSTTTTLTAASSTIYRPSLGNLILLLNPQPHKTGTPYCHYQQHHHHQHHHQKYRQQSSQLLQNSQQQQQYNSIATSTIHLQLPSLLVFSRTLIILILLSSLWHTSEGFHGSGVKLSTNTVKTKYGLVRGIVVRSSPSLVEAYLGIPYASPPVGSLRFMPPITPSTWKNVRNADRFSPVCPQNVPIPPNGPEALLEVPRARLAQLRRLLPLLSNQSEDCLYLNIYVPYENRRHRRFTTNSGESNDSPKLPTILFIHGESYEWNSGNPYDGSELAAHGNVIVVTINFRLGILGFLKTGGKESAQGNFGLMDLVAGLHWLKENLPAFGGDPQAITLLGHGTGAALANILVVSPVASDLVQHTVMVSGSALSPWAIQKNPLFVKRRVAEQTGCHGDMLYYDLAPCLRTKSLAELLAVKIDHPRFLVGFAPFIDGTVISPNTDAIGKLSLPLGSAIVSTSGIEYANFPKRNLIFCLTSVESHLDLSAQDLEFGFNETRRDRILRTYVRNNFHYHLNEIFAVLKNEYTDWDKAIRSPLSSRDATLQFLSDGHTASSLIKLGYMHSLRGGRGYFLHFKHRTVEEEYPQRTGSVRGEDVPFWLGLPISPLFPHNYTTQEKQISRLMLRYLANFAKTGNPNQSSLSSPLPSSSSLIGGSASSSSSLPSSASSSVSSSSNQAADDSHDKVKRSSFNIVNASTSSTSSGPIKSNAIVVDVATAAAREALNLAVLYNQRRTKRTYYKRHSRSNDDHSGSASNEVNYFLSTNNNNNNINKLDSDELPFWDAYDVVNQLYMELGNKAEIQSHYRGHKLSMWLNLIPQLHRHANMNDQSMRHHQFQDDLNNLNLYEGIVRAQIQTKPDDDDETLLLPKGRPTPPPPSQENNTTQKPIGGTTECGVDGAMFVAEMTTVPPSDNRSLVLDSREKEMATASTGLIGNLEVLRRLSGKQFQSYTTALVATVAVGCFLLILNILIFAGIYHQREKRARDAKTKEELQDNDTSKNSSMLKLNALGSETGSFNGSGAGVSGKTTVVFGEYSCYDEKSLQTKDEKLIVELPPPQMIDPNWAACSTSTLDLLKTKHHTPLDTTYTLSNVVPINTESQTDHLMAVNAMEMSTYNPMSTGLIIDPSLAATSSSGLLSKRGSFVGSSGQLNQYDFASVQSSDQMSFKDIENAVKASATMDDDITHDDDIPEPPPPPRSFHSMQQQQGANIATTGPSGSGGGGGILRQAGTTSATQTGGGKKRVHIQEISV